MVTIIITGHGNFATGLLSAIELIAGKQEHAFAVDFLENYSTENLKERLKEAISKGEKEILILTDLLGGSPYNESVKLKVSKVSDYNIEVLTGTNLPMVLNAVLMKSNSSKELMEELIAEGRSNIKSYIPKIRLKKEQEEGI